jgi:ABC-type multidrug transport system fused ATPase/permease subunit
MSGDRDAYRAGWRMLGRELVKQRPALVAVAAWSVPEALPALLSGLLVAHALDEGFLVHRRWTGLGWLGVLAGCLLIKAIATRMSFPWLAATIEPLRDSIVRTLIDSTLRRAASARRPDGGSIAQLTSQVEMTRQLVSALIRGLRPSAFSLLAAIAGMTLLSPVIPAIVIPPVVLSIVIFCLSLGSLNRRRTSAVMAAEAIAKEAGGVLAGLRDVIACGAQDRAAADAGIVIEAQARATRAIAWAGSVRVAIVALGYYVPLIALLSAAPWLTRHGWLATGQIIGAVTYLTTSLWPALSSLTGSVGSWGIQLGSVLRRLEQACTPPHSVSSPGTGTPAGAPAGWELRISGLTFAYSTTSEPVIRDLSLILKQGEHLTVVGPSGTGKSTLTRLVAGLQPAQCQPAQCQPAQRGQITFGGAALPTIPEPVLRQRIALVPQEAYIFSGTLRENLTYLRPDATTADLDACSVAVGLWPLAKRLGGYEAVLGDGQATLSDGERQLIAAARAYLSPASLVILDEATCHLDPTAEAHIEQAFAARRGSLIVIAHRISSAQRADRVLLLDGTRTNLGTHRELLENSTQYADLAGAWRPAHLGA